MKRTLTAALLFSAAPAGSAGAAFAQDPPATEVGAAQLALPNLPARDQARLTVKSPSFPADGDIPVEYTQYGANTFPGLEWSAGPAGTKSYAVIMQDGDALREGAPILHWTIANVPATMLKLDAGMTAAPDGAMHGPNIRGANQPYMGPRTPAGPKHRYHFQVFALDTTLPESALASYSAMIDAMKGHVLQSGEVVGRGKKY